MLSISIEVEAIENCCFWYLLTYSIVIWKYVSLLNICDYLKTHCNALLCSTLCTLYAIHNEYFENYFKIIQ